MRPLIPGKINGADTMFLADSGSYYSILTPAAVGSFKLNLEPGSMPGDLLGFPESVKLHMTTVRHLTLGTIPLSQVDFLVGGSETEAGAAGTLGQNVFRIADVEYDLANGVIRLMRAKDCGQLPLAYWRPTGPFSEMEIIYPRATAKYTTGEVYLNGTKLRIMFQTGAPVSTIARTAAERAGIDLHGEGVTAGGYVRDSGGRLLKTWIAPVASFKIGNEDIRQTRLRVADETWGWMDMVIGTDFFLSHRVYIASDRRKVYFTYNGGPVFNLSTGRAYDAATDGSPERASSGAATPSGGDPDPEDAAGYARRGTGFVARHEYARAVADLTRATAMAPEDASYQYWLGIALHHNRQPVQALAALDASLKLKPDDPMARLARVVARNDAGDTAGALDDTEAVSRILPRNSDLRRNVAAAYLTLGLYEKSVEQLDTWLAAHKQDDAEISALNSRCWARAAWNHDLPKALADCNEAAKRSPNTARILDSRALVRLRLGDYPGAIADYDAALAINPKLAWSFYGRGIAKQRLGRIEDGKADLDAAVAVDPNIVKTATKVGVVP